jgi:Cysteine-rich secretory protein family
VGIEGRDWYRDERRPRGGRSNRGVVAGVVIGIVLVLAASPAVSSRLGYTPPLGIANLYPDSRWSGQPSIGLLPGTPGVLVGARTVYPTSAWAPWLAGEGTCPRGDERDSSPAVQVQVQLCLLNFARAREGLQSLVLSRELSATAASKARDIVACGEFAHEACGKQVFDAAQRIGYPGPLGENLYVAEGELAAPRPAVDGWLNSAGHRENLFREEWTKVGIALQRAAEIQDIRGGVVWVNHFGT